jgi:hypothetical protein
MVHERRSKKNSSESVRGERLRGLRPEISRLVDVPEDRLVEAAQVDRLHVRLGEEATETRIRRPRKDTPGEKGRDHERVPAATAADGDDERARSARFGEAQRSENGPKRGSA